MGLMLGAGGRVSCLRCGVEVFAVAASVWFKLCLGQERSGGGGDKRANRPGLSLGDEQGSRTQSTALQQPLLGL